MTDVDRPEAPKSILSRRLFLAGLPLALGGCVGSSAGMDPVPGLMSPNTDPKYLAMYGADPSERFPLPAVDLRQIGKEFLRRQVRYESDEPVGTIIVDTGERHLYLVQPDGRAMRYGIGVGREGFAWSGRAVIRRKAEWPSWHPPVEMQERDEKARKWADGMPGGLQNPLGARALYLYQGGRDTLYRIHGTNEPWTIGTNVSSGCIRMINQDVIDLYERVPVDTEVVVKEAGGWV